MPAPLMHLMKERKGTVVVTKCGISRPWVEVRTTVWSVDVTCPACDKATLQEAPT